MTKIQPQKQQSIETSILTGEQIEQNFATMLSQSNSLVEFIKTEEDSDRIDEIYRSAKIVSINPKKIKIDERLNIRSGIDQIIINDYARMMKEGDTFPPIDSIVDGQGEHIAVDGRLTLEAALLINAKKIRVRILDCDLNFAFGVKIQNSAIHRQNWSQAEKKPFVIAILRTVRREDKKFRKIGRFFKIDHKTVSKWYKEIEDNAVSYIGENPQSDLTSGGENPQPGNNFSKLKEYTFPVEALRIHRELYSVNPGECYRAQAPDGTNHYVFCADNNGPVLAPFYGLNIFGMLCCDGPWGHDVPNSGRTYKADSGNSYFGNTELRGINLELLMMNALANINKCLRPGATYTAFTGYKERHMFENHFSSFIGMRTMPLTWVKANFTRSLHGLTSYGTEEAILGWKRGGQKPQRTEGIDNVYLGCNYRENGIYGRREFLEDSEYDVGGECHSCSKPVLLLKLFIERYSKPKEVVVDNFAGSGSTGVACFLSGRQFVGIELIPEFVAVTLHRLAKLGCTISKVQPDEPFLFPTISVLGADFFDNGVVK